MKVSKNVKKALRPKGQKGSTLMQEKKFERTRKKAFGLLGNHTK